jgi:hypothetical protein
MTSDATPLTKEDVKLCVLSMSESAKALQLAGVELADQTKHKMRCFWVMPDDRSAGTGESGPHHAIPGDNGAAHTGVSKVQCRFCIIEQASLHFGVVYELLPLLQISRRTLFRLRALSHCYDYIACSY